MAGRRASRGRLPVVVPLGVLLALALMLVVLARPGVVEACIIAVEPLRMTPAGFSDLSTLIVVGEVEQEQPYEHADELFQSTVRVVATLMGTRQERVFLHGVGGHGLGCYEAARLREGERVVLFLNPYRVAPQARELISPDGDDMWLIAYHGAARYTLRDGAAWFELHPLRVDPGTRNAGDPELLIRSLAEMHGSSAREVQQAMAFVRGEDAPVRDDRPTIVAGAFLLVVAVGLAIAGWRVRRRV